MEYYSKVKKNEIQIYICINMDKFQHVECRKEIQKNMYMLYDSIYMVFKTKAKLIYGNRNENSNCFWMWGN